MAQAVEKSSLFSQYYQTRDPKLRNELVMRYQEWARSLACRFANRGEPLEDLVDVAIIGLINSIDRFDPKRGAKFSTYAKPVITGDLRRHFRDKTWSLKVPRQLQERSVAIRKTYDTLIQEIGHLPSISELAAMLELSVDEVLAAMDAGSAHETVSLGNVIMSLRQKNTVTLEDLLSEFDANLEKFDEYGDLHVAIDGLEPRLRAVIIDYYFSDLTQSQIGKKLNISQMHAGRLQKKAERELKKALEIYGSQLH